MDIKIKSKQEATSSKEQSFDIKVPNSWQSLSDSQLQYFFTQFSHDLPMEEILTLCLFKWADLRVLCKTHDGSYLVKRRHKQKQEATLTIRQVQVATASLDFLRQFAPLPVRISKIRRATADITKEEAVLSMDTWRALTELDAKAKEVEDTKRQTK